MFIVPTRWEPQTLLREKGWWGVVRIWFFKFALKLILFKYTLVFFVLSVSAAKKNQKIKSGIYLCAYMKYRFLKPCFIWISIFFLSPCYDEEEQEMVSLDLYLAWCGLWWIQPKGLLSVPPFSVTGSISLKHLLRDTEAIRNCQVFVLRAFIQMMQGIYRKIL